MHELTKIAEEYVDATDKTPNTTYKIKHSYTEFYGPLFEPIRYNKLNVLEIGVRWGGSVLMWRDYFKNSQIYGMDIQFNALRVGLTTNRVHTIKANAYSQDTIDSLKEKKLEFDIIIDDGSHKWWNQLFVFNEYRQLLRPWGIICVEDILSDVNADYIFKWFNGDKNRLYVVDRTRCETAYFDERIIVYR